ncbi:15747_t:CDS:2, partial [Funneliformis geosporum]
LEENGMEFYGVKNKPGDGGIDIFGGLGGNTIVIQCKAYKKKIGVKFVRELEGVLTRYHKDTIGVLVAPSKNKFTTRSEERAETSGYNIILTDKTNICSDLIKFIDSQKVVEIQQVVEN